MRHFTPKRWAIVAGLLFVASVSTSHAQSSEANCAANWSDLRKHPEAGGSCSPERLKGLIRAAQGEWQTFGATVSFEQIGEGENFYIKLNGKNKYGRICCTRGVWSIDGKTVKLSGNSIQIGSYTLSRSGGSSSVATASVGTGGRQ